MELINKIQEKKRYIKFAGAVAIVALSLFAMFGAPSMSAGGSSQFSIVGLSCFTIILVGFALGCYGTIVGIGGGPLILPLLAFSYGWENEQLVATSLFIVFLNALSGSAGYALQKRIDYNGGLKFAMAALPGAIISGFVHHVFDIRVFDMLFGIFLVLLALYSLVSVRKMADTKKFTGKKMVMGTRRVRFVDSFGKIFDFRANDKLGISMNLFLGFFVGFLGIGGGVFQVPILLFLLCYPPHIATATSHFVTMLTCAFALLPHFFLGNIYFNEAIWMGLGIVVGAQVGSRLAVKIDSRLLIHLFVVILVIFALKMFM
jgi:uncharacterized membrane protein YfcA